MNTTEKQIIKLYRTGKSYRDIKYVLSVSSEKICAVLKQAGITIRQRVPISEECTAKILELRNSGLSVGKISKQAGVSEKTAYTVIKSHNMPMFISRKKTNDKPKEGDITAVSISPALFTKKKPDVPDTKGCQGCGYWRRIDCLDGKNTSACHYLLDVGHSRGCESGSQCTKKAEKQNLKIERKV